MSIEMLKGWLARFYHQKSTKVLITVFICLAVFAFPWISQSESASPRRADAKWNAPTSLPAGKNQPPVSLAKLISKPATEGITRAAQIHTGKAVQTGNGVTHYTVKKGDTIFDIADQFGLQPSTILWGNLNKLADNPELIYPNQVLNILPVDGVYYQWQKGDGLHGVSTVLGVQPEDIINYPGNHLDANTIGDLSHPNIAPGTWIIIPNGHRNFITWSAPTISRFNPSVAKIYGPGACAKPTDGAVGTGTFTWPTVEQWLSGYDYTTSANHPAVDFAGSMGNAIYAADNGVVVYAGWNDWGYGNVTVIDHGNGYQTLYGHQSAIKVSCGQSVSKGDLIGLMGSTGRSSGPHLHFEMWYNSSHVNPHDFLPIAGK